MALWLAQHPTVLVVCRDRSALYADGLRRGAPQAVQVVDRFRLVKNLREAAEAFLHQEDLTAVKAGLTLPWSNGPTEGHIHRLKLLKRQGYGRAGVGLLRQRVMQAV